MLYNQPLSLRFGVELSNDIRRGGKIDPYWDELSIAVAWVRASGTAHLSDALSSFLTKGGTLKFVVGIDLHNTTREGLAALLEFEKLGNCSTYVCHNEAGSIFHPKVYLFENEEEARLIVGSNNLTAAGLYINVEAGLRVDASADEDVIVQARQAIDSWRDPSTNMAKKLTDDLLDQLVANGYVTDENAMKTAQRKRQAARANRSGSKLFGARSYRAPSTPPAPQVTGKNSGSAGPSAATAPAGNVLLMRLRSAGPARSTQTQIPKRLANTFFAGVVEVQSAHSATPHGINPAAARGNDSNTLKLEIPEMRDFSDRFARFERTANGVTYEVYDIGTPKGNQIKQRLDAGFLSGDTQMSISDKSTATWWLSI